MKQEHTADMARDINGTWGYAAWCANPNLLQHAWIDDEPFPGKKPCPTCGAKRSRIHANFTLGDLGVTRHRRRATEGEHGWRTSKHYGWVFRSRHLNREIDTYTEIVALLDGTVIREVQEPLSLHTHRGSARRRPLVSPPPIALRQMAADDFKLTYHVVARGKRGWDALNRADTTPVVP